MEKSEMVPDTMKMPLLHLSEVVLAAGLSYKRPSMLPKLISPEPVAIPLNDVPEEFRLPEGANRRVIKAGEVPVDCSLCLSSLTFCVQKCEGDAVTIEAWFPWDDNAPIGAHSYLTREAMECLAHE